MRYTICAELRDKKPWVAKILGENLKYEFSRKFIRPVVDRGNGLCYWHLPTGVYECCFNNGQERGFVCVLDGEAELITKDALKQVLRSSSALTF